VGNAFDVGDEVLTAGGIVGYVIDIDGDRVTLETSVGASFVVLRQYILRKLVDPDAVEDEHHDDDDDEYGDARGELEAGDDEQHDGTDGPHDDEPVEDADGSDGTPPTVAGDDNGTSGGRGPDGPPII
jgi:hypothetical protein